MASEENSSRGKKIRYWLEYSLHKFKGKFWAVYIRQYGSRVKSLSLLLKLVEDYKLKPKPPKKTPRKEFGKYTHGDYHATLEMLMNTIAILEIEQDPGLAEQIVLTTHPKEVPDIELVKLAKKSKKNIEDSSEDFFQQIDLFKAHSILLGEEYKLTEKKTRKFFENDADAFLSLELMVKWRHYMLARNFERINQLPPHTVCQVSIEELDQLASSGPVKGEYLGLMQKMADFQNDPSWEAYTALKETLIEKRLSGRIEKTELKDAFRILINFLLRRITYSDPHVLEEANRLFFDTIQSQLFLFDDQIHSRDLKSIIAILVRLDQPVQARSFFELYKEKIFRDDRGFARDYNRAVVLFLEGRFSEAGRLFYQIMQGAHDSYLKADGRIYAIRCLIELQVDSNRGEVDLFVGTEDSFRMFFSRLEKSPSSAYYMAYYKLLAEFLGIWDYLPEKKTPAWKKLYEKVQSFPDPYLSSWLLGKIQSCLDRN